MQKNMKPGNSETEDNNVILENVNDDEAATERFLNRLELQRKLLINFIGPVTEKPAGKPENEKIKPERKCRK
ncbi:MAG: hypothetical protein V1775_10605 [Bacteroidota bacterium]